MMIHLQRETTLMLALSVKCEGVVARCAFVVCWPKIRVIIDGCTTDDKLEDRNILRDPHV